MTKLKDILIYQDSDKVVNYIRAFDKHGFKFIFWWRIAKRSSRFNPLGIFARRYINHLTIKYGFQIPLTVEIGEGLDLPHFGGIVINSKVKIGKNCYIGQNVTIGHEKRGKRKGAPTIGEGVFFAANAVVVGKVTIGHNVLVAPNAFINCDVDANSVVFGNPCIIKRKENATEGYIKGYAEY